jgi:hypothetical protein
MDVNIDVIKGLKDNKVIAQGEHQVFADRVALVAAVFGFVLDD